jgi:hypothetical protein
MSPSVGGAMGNVGGVFKVVFGIVGTKPAATSSKFAGVGRGVTGFPAESNGVPVVSNVGLTSISLFFFAVTSQENSPFENLLVTFSILYSPLNV